jgi:hypothetical protein
MAEFLEWIDAEEPLTVDQVASQARLDADVAGELATYISTIIVPGARQLAETRSGSAIRKAKYRDTLQAVPRGAVLLDMGQAYELSSVSIAGTALDPAAYRLVKVDRDRQVRPTAECWPAQGEMVVEYSAGVDVAQYPSVVQWMLLAAAWMIEQPAMFTVGDAVESLPTSYVDGLLAPVSVPARF